MGSTAMPTNQHLLEKLVHPRLAVYPVNTWSVTERFEFISLSPHNRVINVGIYDPSCTDK